jgi:rhodanese-related sulfurtransferase
MDLKAKEVAKYIGNPNYVCIDVREEWEYEAGHIPKSINKPLSTISEDDLPKDKKIIFYCKSGIRSRFAAKRFMKHSCYNLLGGLIEWDKAKLPHGI